MLYKVEITMSNLSKVFSFISNQFLFFLLLQNEGREEIKWLTSLNPPFFKICPCKHVHVVKEARKGFSLL